MGTAWRWHRRRPDADLEAAQGRRRAPRDGAVGVLAQCPYWRARSRPRAVAARPRGGQRRSAPASSPALRRRGIVARGAAVGARLSVCRSRARGARGAAGDDDRSAARRRARRGRRRSARPRAYRADRAAAAAGAAAGAADARALPSRAAVRRAPRLPGRSANAGRRARARARPGAAPARAGDPPPGPSAHADAHGAAGPAAPAVARARGGRGGGCDRISAARDARPFRDAPCPRQSVRDDVRRRGRRRPATGGLGHDPRSVLAPSHQPDAVGTAARGDRRLGRAARRLARRRPLRIWPSAGGTDTSPRASPPNAGSAAISTRASTTTSSTGPPGPARGRS